MVPKQLPKTILLKTSFRAVLFRMVPKLEYDSKGTHGSFRAVLFRMVPKQAMSDAE